MPTNPADYDRRYRETRKELRKRDAGILLKMMDILQSLHKNVEFLAQEITSLRKDSRAREYMTLSSLPKKDSSESGSTVSGGRKATRLPTDWNPSIDDREYAARKGLDPDAVAERFRNHWLAKSGKDACKLDWSRTWQNWCITDAERKGHVNGHRAVSAADSPEINEMRAKQLAELASKGIHVLPGSMT